MNSNYDNISLLIIGYDPYKDVWDHYFTLLNKYWGDRPKTYLATNTLNIEYDGVTVLPAGEDAEWSKKVIYSLRSIDTEYVVLLLEDFFTTAFVDGTKISELVNLMSAYHLDYCKLLNQTHIKGEPFRGIKYLSVIDRESEYGISLQPAIWRAEFLSKLVGSDNYNAWIFELNQLKEKQHNKNSINCIADKRNILEITHAVVQSKYLRRAIKVFKKQDYYIDISVRSQLSIQDTIKYNSKCFFSEYTPKKFKPVFKRFGRLLRINYVSDREMESK
jgi:hypothetical protein